MVTKKVKHAGRFKSRYGVGIRKRVIKVEEKQRQRFDCPDCGFNAVKRKGTGLFECKKCGAVFAGGCYLPQTMTGSIVKKMVTQKSFVPSAKALIETTEKTKAPEEEKKKAAKKTVKKEKPKAEKKTVKKAEKKEAKEAEEVKEEKPLEKKETKKEEKE
jgi:large subunit ribosomal protein L37Ae